MSAGSSKINLGRLYALLVLWIVLLAAPGVLEVLGTFGHFNMNSNIEGGIIGVWIIGYLAQFGIFMWISRIVDTGILAWFAASALPWAIDWTTPVSPLLASLWIAIAMGFAVYIAGHARRDEALRDHGVHATATVTKVFQPMFNVIVNGAYIKRKLQLRVEGVKGTPAYDATMSSLFMFGDVPSVGDKIPLLVDPQDPQRFEYDDTSTGDDTSSTPDGTASSSADDRWSKGVGSTSIADELGKLATLHRQGVLSDDEFDAAKKKALT